MRLLVTRPDEDQAALAETLDALGHQTIAAPLLAVRFLADAAIPDTPYQAILITSANGARALRRRREVARLATLPVLAVGEASAAAARVAGFADVASAEGDVEALAELALRRLEPGGGPLLHVAGSVVAGDLKTVLEGHGFSVDRVTLYEAVAAERLPIAAADALRAGAIDGALFYSPRTARSFAALVQMEGVAQTLVTVTAYCLSQAVAEALAGLPFKAVAIAPEPNQAALLGLLA